MENNVWRTIHGKKLMKTATHCDGVQLVRVNGLVIAVNRLVHTLKFYREMIQTSESVGTHACFRNSQPGSIA